MRIAEHPTIGCAVMPRPNVMILGVLAAICIAAVCVSGCGGDGGGGDGDEDQARGVVERFGVALDNEDYAEACSLTSSRLERQFSGFPTRDGGLEVYCRDLRNPVYKGLTIADLVVEGDTATATFQDSPVTVRLLKEGDTWKVDDYSTP